MDATAAGDAVFDDLRVGHELLQPHKLPAVEPGKQRKTAHGGKISGNRVITRRQVFSTTYYRSSMFSLSSFVRTSTRLLFVGILTTRSYFGILLSQPSASLIKTCTHHVLRSTAAAARLRPGPQKKVEHFRTTQVHALRAAAAVRAPGNSKKNACNTCSLRWRGGGPPSFPLFVPPTVAVLMVCGASHAESDGGHVDSPSSP